METRLPVQVRDKTVLLWDVQTGKQRFTLNGHKDVVNMLMFSPDSTMLASSSSDKTVFLWDVQTGEVLKMLVGHTDLVREVMFSPDGKMVASASAEILVWDALLGERLYALEAPVSLTFLSLMAKHS